MLPLNNMPSLGLAKDSVLDANSLNHVKAMGRADDPQALKEVAKQFEAIFIQQMLKGMRDASAVFAEDSYFNSNEMQFHQDLFDQQMSLELSSGRGLGLADALYQQMLRAYGGETEKSGVPQINPFAEPVRAPTRPAARTETSSPTHSNKMSIAGSPGDFVKALRPYAEQAAEQLNVNADVLLAQAALETGWGRHVLRTPQGESSFNLFNIKADQRWEGDKVNVMTLEYKQGVASQERADFRSYQNYAESFSDYVSFMKSNPRYSQALTAGADSRAYAEALQQAGYATDPKYAEKIKRILASDNLGLSVNEG